MVADCFILRIYVLKEGCEMDMHGGVYLFLADVWFGRVLRATGTLRGARVVILLSRFIVGWQARLAYPGIVIFNGIGQACLDWWLPLLVSRVELCNFSPLVEHLDPAFSNPHRYSSSALGQEGQLNILLG